MYEKSAGLVDLLIRTQCLNFVDNASILYWRSFLCLSNIPDRKPLIGLQGSNKYFVLNDIKIEKFSYIFVRQYEKKFEWSLSCVACIYQQEES